MSVISDVGLILPWDLHAILGGLPSLSISVFNNVGLICIVLLFNYLYVILLLLVIIMVPSLMYVSDVGLISPWDLVTRTDVCQCFRTYIALRFCGTLTDVCQ